jgi:RNA polymerase sigma-70 factor (ECF subfamily)
MLRKRGQADDGIGVGGSAGAHDDVRLIERIITRDRRAFEALYREYHPRLTRFLMNMLRRPHLAEEALNDAMMVVWRRPEAFNGTSKVSTWIFAIAYRTALKRLSRHDEPREDLDGDLRPSLDPSPEDQLSQSQTRAQLLRAMDKLSPDHRTVIDLTYFHEIDYKDIAEIMDCPVGTVKTRMHHARLRLRQVLTADAADRL